MNNEYLVGLEVDESLGSSVYGTLEEIPGGTITVDVPAPRHTSSLALNAMVAGLRGRPIQVVLADAYVDNRDVAAESLRESGFDVTTASDGVALLALLGSAAAKGSHGPDVAVLNLHLPYLSGLDVLATMRAARWSMPVIVVMYNDDDYSRARIRALDGEPMRGCPFDADRLCEAIFSVYVRPRSRTIGGSDTPLVRVSRF